MKPRSRFARKILIWLAALLLLASVGGRGIAAGQGGPPGFKAVNIAAIPLYAAPEGDKPALTLALAVEYPAAGAQYVAPDHDGSATPYLDASYSPERQYLGYYHPEMCYTYIDQPAEAPAAGLSAADYKRFKISGPAAGRRCSDAFSGNFLNWASSAAIDMFRLALTGGDRLIDEEGLTILQRAPASGGDPKCMWNSDVNPAKRLDIGDGSYSGAIPKAMIQAAGGAPSIWIATFLNRIFFGIKRADTSAAPFNQNAPVGGCSQGAAYTLASALSSDGFFYARTQVCGSGASGHPAETRDYYSGRPYCTKYPNGDYKPTGVIQQYGGQLRLAAFGYALDQTPSCQDAACANPGRYGGVLRVPMKYAGPRTYDENGVENTPPGGNPRAEWDPHTGIFVTNPDGDATQTPGISGVINYINKQGRTGPVPGRYKQYDPSSELYYETLRYLQGLPPSPAAVGGLSAAMYDGFPIFTDWSLLDPYGGPRSSTASYACVNSNIALIGAVHDSDATSQPAPGSDSRRRTPASADPAGNIPDIAAWNAVVQAFEKGTSAGYVDGQGVARTTGGNTSPNPYVGETSQTTATVPGAPNNPRVIAPLHDILGLAYWAHTHDIRGSAWSGNPSAQRPGLRVTSFLFDMNPLGQQTPAAVRRGWNQFYMAAKYGGFRTQPTGDAGAPYNTQGNPLRDQHGAAHGDVWQDPSRPGEPQNYFMMGEARSVFAAFDTIFSRAVVTRGGIAGAASSGGGHITQGQTLVYQASFDTGRWSGDVRAYAMRADAVNPEQIDMDPIPVWSASGQLAQRTLPRNIVVGQSVAGGQPSPAATEFTAGAIEAGLRNSLNSFPGQAADGLWQERLRYLRGDTAHEGALLRRRDGLLGGVAHSGVAYAGAPAPSAASGHAAFAAAHAQRAPAVYVGAGDGMLHAFDAATGDELFAYIPSWLGPHLAALTDPGYGSGQMAPRAYVDATPVIGDARIGADENKGEWKTVLLCGTGGGGRGVFALDVTDPAAFGPSKVLWEFTQRDDPDMGFVLGSGRIVRMRTSAPDAVTPTWRWFALVPAGVNSHVPGEDGIFSSTGAPTIFLLALDKPAGQAWVQGGNYHKISLPVDAALAASMAPGIVNLEALTDISGTTDYIFAGDLHGKLWELDFTQAGAADWQAAKVSRFTTGPNGMAYPMYIAKDPAGAIQPITAAPVILQGPASGTHYVGFGTGKYIEPADSGTTQTNTFYVLYDNGSGTATSGTPGEAGIAGRGRLAPVTAGDAGRLAPPDNFAWGAGRPSTDGDLTQRAGWYHDLPAAGERIVHDAAWVALTSKAAFGSLIPAASAEPGVCAPGGGSGASYYLDLVTAQGLTQTSRVGIMGTPLIAFNDEQTTTSAPDSTGRALRTRPTVLIQQGAQGLNARPIATETIPVGRLSWRQINNYLELKNQ